MLRATSTVASWLPSSTRTMWSTTSRGIRSTVAASVLPELYAGITTATDLPATDMGRVPPIHVKPDEQSVFMPIPWAHPALFRAGERPGSRIVALLLVSWSLLTLADAGSLGTY